MPLLSSPDLSSSTPTKVLESIKASSYVGAAAVLAETTVEDTAKGDTRFVSPEGYTDVPLEQTLPPTIIATNPERAKQIDEAIEESNQGVVPALYTWIRYYLDSEAMSDECCYDLALDVQKLSFKGSGCPGGWIEEIFSTCDTYEGVHNIYKCSLEGQASPYDPGVPNGCPVGLVFTPCEEGFVFIPCSTGFVFEQCDAGYVFQECNN